MSDVVAVGGGPRSVEVILTWAEVLVASNVGVMRNVQSLKQGREPVQGMGIDMWAANIEGAAGEMAVAKMQNVFWSGAIGDAAADDVGSYQVKTNASRKWDDLILRSWNKPDRVYISVLSFLPRFVVTGWVWGADAMQEQYYREGVLGMPAYFFPRALLHDLATLPHDMSRKELS